PQVNKRICKEKVPPTLRWPCPSKTYSAVQYPSAWKPVQNSGKEYRSERPDMRCSSAGTRRGLFPGGTIQIYRRTYCPKIEAAMPIRCQPLRLGRLGSGGCAAINVLPDDLAGWQFLGPRGLARPQAHEIAKGLLNELGTKTGEFCVRD